MHYIIHILSMICINIIYITHNVIYIYIYMVIRRTRSKLCHFQENVCRVFHIMQSKSNTTRQTSQFPLIVAPQFYIDTQDYTNI